MQIYGEKAQSFPVERNPVKIICSEKDSKEVIQFCCFKDLSFWFVPVVYYMGRKKIIGKFFKSKQFF